MLRWNDKGFGFIKADHGKDGEDVFVHVKNIADGSKSLPTGARVAFKRIFDEKQMKVRADQVRVVSVMAPAEGGLKRKRPEFKQDERGWVNQSCWFCIASPQFEVNAQRKQTLSSHEFSPRAQRARMHTHTLTYTLTRTMTSHVLAGPPRTHPLQSHFVVSVGEEAYVCMAKGPLLPQHALILPIAHVPCSLFLPDAAAAEVAQYVSGLRRCFEARGAALLLFERYMGSGSFEHMHIQALAIPSELAGGAREAFETHGRKVGVGFEVLPLGVTVGDRLGATPEPFFSVTLPSGETLLHRMATSARRHPLQFGREVVAGILGNARRADWKLCLPQPAPGEQASTQECAENPPPPRAETHRTAAPLFCPQTPLYQLDHSARSTVVHRLEARMAEDFKNAFAPFDPTRA